MASYYDTHQWYQSGRSSAAQHKIEKKIEMETNGSDFPPPCRYDKSPETFDEKLSLALKRIDELIERNKKSSQKMIEDQFSPRNHSDFSPNHVSTYPLGCEETSIEESSLSANGEESQQFTEAGAVKNFQVSLQTKNCKLYKKYKLYSAVELDDRRDRGLCLWCDEIFFVGHECCKKKLYIYEIDIDEDLAVSENNLMKPLVDVKLVEENISHCDKHLIVDCVQKDSSELSNFVYVNENGSGEASEVLGYNCKVGNYALQMFEVLPKKTTLENVAENYVILTTDFECNKLWLDDVGCGKLMAIMFMNHSPSVIEALFSLLSRLGGLH